MRKITFLMLLVTSVILCPTKSQAQMQSLMTTSAKRVLNPITTAMTPVKSVAVNSKSIITAINYECLLPSGSQINGAAFYLTDDDSNAASGPNYGAKVGHLSNFQITDMEIDRNEIFFCGTKNHVPFFARTSLTNLINGGVVDIFMLPTMGEVFKIDVYKNPNGERKVSLIGYDGRYVFIDVHLPSLHNKAYIIDNIKLLDVRHGANTVAVLGQRENGKFVLISHNRNDLQNYNGCLYQTPQLYLDDSIGNYHYLLEMYRDNVNDIAIVGYSGMDFSSGTTISLIQLSNMSVMHTQAVDSRKEVRSKFKDMRIDDSKSYLLCLIENPMTGFNDNIFVLNPMYVGSYNVNVAIPDTNTYANYFTSLAPYIGSASYMVLGKNNGVTLFDKISSSYSNLNCAGNTSFRVDTIEKIQRVRQIEYDDIHSLPINHDTVNSAFAVATYSIICQ